MKREKRSITGVLLLDKPLGISSNAALTRVKILYHASKAGHTGTLDPFASGLLPVCLGEATKFAGFMLNADKAYEATIRLGKTTTTGDREGAALTDLPVQVTEAAVIEALGRFVGHIKQLPPMHSAIKFQGQPLYRLARQGVEIPRAMRDITIHRLDLIAFESPLIKVTVTCSKGTYIRVLAEDIGRDLGCGGTLETLRRNRSGGFALTNAVTLEELENLSLEDRDMRLVGPDQLVFSLPEIKVDEHIGRAILEGRVIAAFPDMPSGTYRAYSKKGEFFGIVEVEEGVMRARRMMSAF